MDKLKTPQHRAWRKPLMFALAGLTGMCVAAKSADDNPHELVLRKSAAIEASLGGRTIYIEALDELTRVIHHGDCKYEVNLRPRSERWFGNKGAYNPGLSRPGSIECGGISRIVFTEGQIHLIDKSFALEWLKKRPRLYLTAYNKNGLVVSWRNDQYRSQINVDIDLMCMDGHEFDPGEYSGTISGKTAHYSDKSTVYKCKYTNISELKETKRVYEEEWEKYWK